MTDSDESEPYREALRSVRSALEEGDTDEALEELLEARDGGFEHDELDETIESLRDDPGEGALEEVAEWLEGLELLGESGGESAESDDEQGEVPEFQVEAGVDGDFAGAGKSEIEGAKERPDADSTARDAGDSGDSKGDSWADFTRDSNEVTAVGHESLADLDSDELEAVEHDLEGASAEFDRLPSADFDVVTDVELEEDTGSEDVGDGGADESEPFDRETKRNPVVDKIAWNEFDRFEAPEESDDETGFDGSEEGGAYLEEDSDAEDFEGPESSGAMAALDTEREMQERDDTPRVISAPSDSDDEESGPRRSGEPTPVEPNFATTGVGEASDAVPEEAEEGGETGSGPEPLDDEEFFGLAEELSGADQSDVPEARRDQEESPGGENEQEESSDGENEVERSAAPNTRDGEDESRADAWSRPTSSFDQADLDEAAERRESRKIAQGIVRMLEQAKELLADGHYDSAHDLVQSVLESHPDSERAQDLLSRIERERGDEPQEGEADLEGEASGEEGGEGEESAEDSSPEENGEERLAELRDLEAVPRQVQKLDELPEEGADHRMGFVLSMIDGEMSLEDILELSSMSRDETAGVLVDLVDEGFVEFDDD